MDIDLGHKDITVSQQGLDVSNIHTGTDAGGCRTNCCLRRAQSGRYPWPKGQAGETLEISEKEFEYLLSNQSLHLSQKRAVIVEITALLLYN